MKYKDAIKQAMKLLAKDHRVMFLGYNVRFGSKAYGTLENVPESQCIETPVAENLMSGLATGLSIEGFRPVVFFERHDFVLNALDNIVNHIDKIEKLSYEQFKTPVIIRAVVGSKIPLNPGLQHTQNFTKVLKNLLSFPVIELKTSKQIILEYKKALLRDTSVLFVEYKELYEKEL